ncbi:MAG: cytochrome c-type biogenesis protein [Pseudomonadota bacterium]
MKKLLLGLGLLLSLGLQAGIETYQFDTPEQEASYKRLIAELRCLVCQNQNIADSNAELAQDLRRKTYEMVRQGKSEKEIVAFMVQRYGDFVLYRPPVNQQTLLLWIGPFIIFGVGIAVLFVFVRRRRNRSAPEPAPDNLDRARALLEEDDKAS